MAFSDVSSHDSDESAEPHNPVSAADGQAALQQKNGPTGDSAGIALEYSASPGSLAALTAEVEQLLTRASFPLETADAGFARNAQKQTLKQIQDYVRPRLESHQAPVLAVIGGSTGAGKSTLINSLLGERVTLPGALRPTTRNPVLVHHPDDEQWFTSERILPSLKREHTHSESGLGQTVLAADLSERDIKEAQFAEASKELRLVASEAVPRGLAIIDSPDVDSMVDSNRELAHQLLGAADLWIFLTTAARYADAVPWEALRSAARRQTEVAVVVDRVDPSAMEVVLDLRDMLNQNDLDDAPLFVVEEQPLQDGFLPGLATAHLSEWLAWIMLAPGERDKVVNATRTGAVDALARSIEELAVHSETQVRAHESLVREVERAYDRAAQRISEETSDGSMLRGEVLGRWQDFVGTGEFMRGIEEKISAARDKFTAYFRGKTAAPKVQRAVGDSLFAIVKNQSDEAAESAFSAWHANIAGRPFTNSPSLASSSTQLADSLSYEIRQWQGHVMDLVSQTGASKRSKARALALGTNGLGVALMVVAFATTGGLTGAEIGIAGGTAVLAQRLLESVFGEEAVRKLAQDAQKDLNARVRKVLDAEQQRFLGQLEPLGISESQSAQLRAAARALHSGVAGTHEPYAGSHALSQASGAEGIGELQDKPADSSRRWFGGAVDSFDALELDADFYRGAVLYGTAGTRAGVAQDEGSAQADLGGKPPKGAWWNRIFRPGGTK